MSAADRRTVSRREVESPTRVTSDRIPRLLRHVGRIPTLASGAMLAGRRCYLACEGDGRIWLALAAEGERKCRARVRLRFS